MVIKSCPKHFDFGEEGSGTVHKEELVEHLDREDKDYHKLAQLLEWEHGEWSIRLAYYLKEHGTNDNAYHFGSQNTFVFSIENIDNLVRALATLREEYERIQKEKEGNT
jgi:hypothetical protein